MSGVTTAAINLAVVIEGEGRLAVDATDLHPLRWLNANRMGMRTLFPHKAGIQDKTVMTRETHAFTTGNVLPAGF